MSIMAALVILLCAAQTAQTVWPAVFLLPPSRPLVQSAPTSQAKVRLLSLLKVVVFLTDSPTTTHWNLTSSSLNNISDKPEKDQLKNKFMKKLPRDAEASNVLQAMMLGALTEVHCTMEVAKAKQKAYEELTLSHMNSSHLSAQVFHDIAYKAKDRQDLLAGIDEFLDKVIVIEPPKSLEKNMYVGDPQMNGDIPHDGGHGGGGGNAVGDELKKTGRFCGGLVLDINRKVPFFSDFTDAIHIQALSAILFIYLGTVTNAITFGGLLSDSTENMQGVLESFLGTAIAGGVFCLFAGQPLTILSSTGPVLVFERLLFNLSRDNGFDYLEFRLWIGLWSAFFCLILVATDASFLVQYFTRFTEEGLACLISFIFYNAFKKMLKLAHHYPIDSGHDMDYVTQYDCMCMAPTVFGNGSNIFDKAKPINNPRSSLSKTECLKYSGVLVGKACHFVPDITLMSFILLFGTYTCSMTLRKFKTSPFFPTTVRKLISDFAIILTILIFCGVDILVGVDTPKLILPSAFKPTSPKQGWFVSPFGGNPWWVYLASALPALLVTILIFMDQQITAVIVNRKENKLKKGAGYHLDLFSVAVLMVVCSFMGLPWYVAATIIYIAHIDSLKIETETSAPGEQPKFLGVSSISNILLPMYPLSLLCTCPNHLNLASLAFSPNLPVCVVPLMTSFLILSILVSPKENLSIFNSVTSSSASCLLPIATVSKPYIMAGLTTVL
uniref:Anion exchange protein n=1 Tax=Cynoglossus semilaevis TaxID=244447 RepID=A0A3P8VTU0_CYNSE